LVMSGSSAPRGLPSSPSLPFQPQPQPRQQRLLRPKGCTGKQAALNWQRMPTEPLKIKVWVVGVEVEDEKAAVVGTRQLSS